MKISILNSVTVFFHFLILNSGKYFNINSFNSSEIGVFGDLSFDNQFPNLAISLFLFFDDGYFPNSS